MGWTGGRRATRLTTALATAVAVTAGGSVYLLWRPRTLLVFDWVERLGLTSSLVLLRDWVGPPPDQVPEFVVYALPNALWVFGFTATLANVWSGSRTPARLAWLALPLLISVGTEAGQAVGLVPGTFDPTDLLLAVFAAIAGARFVQDEPPTRPVTT